MNSVVSELNAHRTKEQFCDPLTGLYRRGFFQIALEREIERSKRTFQSFSLALVRIDSGPHLDNGNAGQDGKLLKDVARIIRKNIRGIDMAARLDDGVLALLLIGAVDREASVSAERLRQAVFCWSKGQTTISVGLSSYPSDGKNSGTLLKNARQALIKRDIAGNEGIGLFTADRSPVVNGKPKVLIVDDNEGNRELLDDYLEIEGFDVLQASSGMEVFPILERFDIDLIILDVVMPGLDGFQVCTRLKCNETTRLIPVILLTALHDSDARVKGIEAGADDFISQPANQHELLARAKSLIRFRQLNRNLTSIENVLFSMVKAIEAKSKYTEGHTNRVASLAVAIGHHIGLDERDISYLRLGGFLHDIGKIGISNRILNKRGRLDSGDWQAIRSHPIVGYQICLPLKQTLGPALDIIRHHHEKLDGSGYPDGLRGGQISLVARIIAVADIYDALISERPYRKKMSHEEALAILRGETADGKLDESSVESLAAHIRQES